MKKNLKRRYVYDAACINCGKLLHKDDVKKINGKSYCEACFNLKDKNTTFEFNAPEGILRIFSYIFSFINPLIGFLFGTIFYSQKQNINARTFGKNCLILMFLSFLIILFFLIVSIILSSNVIGGDLFYNIKEGYY